MKRLLVLVSFALLTACTTAGGGGGGGGGQNIGNRSVWHCDGGSAFSVGFTTNGAQVFAGGQTYTLAHAQSGSGARYAGGGVEYWEHAGSATLSGAHGGPYANCHRR